MLLSCTFCCIITILLVYIEYAEMRPAAGSRQDRAWRMKKMSCEEEECGHLIPETAYNCVNQCVSQACFEKFYASNPLEDGEIDSDRRREYIQCVRQEYRSKSNKDNPHLEIMRKEVSWCDDYVEIKCIGIHSAKKFLFRLSAALISAMIQKYYFNLTELWKMLANSAQKKDSHKRDAYVVYKTTRHDEAGEPWNIEFFTNLVEPFDLEVQVQLSRYFERRHYYRIESFLLKSFFEKYCLEKYGAPLITPEQCPKGVIDMSQYPREPNYMLEALADEIIFDKEADEIYVKSVEVLRLETYLEQSNMKHHSEKAKQEHLEHQRSFGASSDDYDQSDTNNRNRSQNNNYRNRNAAIIHREGVTIFSPNTNNSNKKKSVSMHSGSLDEDLLDLSSRLSIITDPQPPPLEKYTSLSALANSGLEKLKALSFSHRQRHSDKLNEEDEGEDEDEDENQDEDDDLDHDSDSRDKGDTTGTKTNKSKRIKLNAADALIRFENQRKKKLSPFENFLLNYNSTPKRVKEIQQKINQIYQENYQAILGTIDDMHILMNRPLEAFKDHFQQQQLQLNSLSSVALMVSPPKSMTKVDQLRGSGDGFGGEEDKLSEEDMQRFIIKEALSIKAELRSTMTTKVIADFLRYKSALGKYLTHCSLDDIRAIADDCTVVEANETTVIDLLHIVQHDPIDNIYLLIEGNLTAKAIPYADEAAALLAAATASATTSTTSTTKPAADTPFFSPSSRKASAKVPHHQKGRVETWKFSPGDIIGETIFTGGLIWEYTLQSPIPTVKEAKFQAISKSRRTLLYQPTLSSRATIVGNANNNNNNNKNQVFGVGTDTAIYTNSNSNASQKHYLLCKIPFITCQRYIGRSGPEVEEFLTYFWKSLRVYLEMKEYNDLILQESLQNLRQRELHPLEYQLAQIKNQFYHHLSPINAIASGRIRTYQAGMDLFSQGQLRHHMFIIKQGSATYYRLFPRELVGDDIIPERIETVCNRNYTGTLLSNDFSFFDSEDITI